MRAVLLVPQLTALSRHKVDKGYFQGELANSLLTFYCLAVPFHCAVNERGMTSYHHRRPRLGGVSLLVAC